MKDIENDKFLTAKQDKRSNFESLDDQILKIGCS